MDFFDYDLPKGRIAQHPLPRGTPSRLLQVHRPGGPLLPGSFEDLPDLLEEGDVLVRNDTRVFKARLRANRLRRDPNGPGDLPPQAVEVLFCHVDTPAGGGESGGSPGVAWMAMVRPARRVRPGDRIRFPGGLEARVTGNEPGGLRRLELGDSESLEETLSQHGEVPLPPYITDPPPDAEERYQTVYARKAGAVAAPTAGLHFEERHFDALREKGVSIVDVTLHVGPGTFVPIRAPDVSQHRMHAEPYHVSGETMKTLRRAKSEGRRVVAVGTTTLRVLESLGQEGLAEDGPLEGWTDLFVRPGFEFTVVDALLTNFHLPRTTLLLLVLAFAGPDLTRRAYEMALERHFRFYSFGDAMLIL